MNLFIALLSVVAVSLISLIGITILSLREETMRKYMYLFVSLAVGALLGDAFIHLIPETFEHFTDPLVPSLLVIGGILFFFILEKFMHWHHHGDDTDEGHVHPVGKLTLISDGVHNFIDGIIIGMSFMVNVPLGIATTVAVVLHEIPQEIGDFAVLLHAGYTRKRALWLNFLSALMAVLGTLAAFFIGGIGEGLIGWILPIAAGGFIYIAMTDLIPELHKSNKGGHSLYQLLTLFVGILLMIGLVFLE